MRVKSTRPVDNFELRSWFFMRISGALILILAFVHLAFVHFVYGVSQINYKFVGQRWATPTWRLFDFFLLTLALAHGSNGARILIDDYIRPKGWRTFMLTGLYVVSLFLLVLGGFVVITFQPR